MYVRKYLTFQPDFWSNYFHCSGEVKTLSSHFSVGREEYTSIIWNVCPDVTFCKVMKLFTSNCFLQKSHICLCICSSSFNWDQLSNHVPQDDEFMPGKLNIQPVNRFHRLLVIDLFTTEKAKVIHVLTTKKLKSVWKSSECYIQTFLQSFTKAIANAVHISGLAPN